MVYRLLEHNMGYIHIYACCIAVLTVSLHVRAQPDPNVCIPGPGDPMGHRLPDLPEQYKFSVHGEFEGRNYSVWTTEVYDDIANLGAVMNIYHGKTPFPGQQSHRWLYYDYGNSQYYNVSQNLTEFDSYDCLTKEITNTTFTAFGFGGGHIPNAKDIFRFGEKYNETYRGQKQYEGETVDWWSTCIYDAMFSHTYLAEFYFRADEHKATLPVRMTINGTAPLHWNSTSPERRSFYHTYSFRNVEIGPQPREAFYPPVGVLCPGRVKGKGIPSVPTNFNLNVEIVRPEEKEISYSKEFYYFEGKLAAFDMIPKDNNKHHHHVRVVHDYNTGIEYTITPWDSCQIRPIPIDRHDAVAVDDAHVIMRTPASFFALHVPDVDWVYEGKTNTRDTVIHAWQTSRTNWKPVQHHGETNMVVNSTWMYFFLDDDWTIAGSWFRDGASLPIRLEIHWVAYNMQTEKMEDRGKEVHNFFQPSMDAVWHTYFDVGDCYTHMNESYHLAFNLEGKDTYKKYVVNNTAQFAHGVARSLAESLDVSLTRITAFKVVDGYKDLATVFFTLLDKPQVQGDAINATDPGPPLNTAYELLQKLINSKDGSTLVLEFIYHDRIMKVNAASNTLREETQPLIQTKQVGLSTGVASGIAIGTFILGAIIAAVCVSAVFKYKNREVPYAVQE